MSSPESPRPGADPASVESPPVEEPTAPRAPWTGGDVAITLVAAFVLLVGLGITIAIGTGGRPSVEALGIGTLVVYGLSFAIGWYVCLNRRGASLADAGFRATHPAWLLGILPLAAIGVGLNWLFTLLSAELFGGVPGPGDQLGLGDDPLSGSDIVWILLFAVVAAPVVEEFMFRGILYRYFRPRTGALAATLVSAMLFAVVHLVPALFLSLLVLGAILAFIVERSGSLYPAIALHALNNGVGIGVLVLTQGA